MDPKLAKRLFWIAIVLGVSIWSIATREPVLGLDLQGGVMIRYRLEPPANSTGEDRDEQINSTIETLRSRLDAYGIGERYLSRQGDDEMLIELPGSGVEEAETIKALVSRVGHLEWRVVNVDDLAKGVNVETERARLATLLAEPENKGRQAPEIDVSSLELDFDDVVYRWVSYSDRKLAERRGAEQLDELLVDERMPEGAELTADEFFLVKFEKGRERRFTGSDVTQVMGQPSQARGTVVSIQMHPSRASEFGDFTGDHVNQLMAVLLDGRIAEDPAEIQDRLPGRFSIFSSRAAGFSDREVKTYVTLIKSGSLQMKPHLLYQNTIGPSLGQSSINSGTWASFAAFIAIILFMLIYYRVHGVIASLCLIANLAMLAGVLLMLRATLTLPGLAGLVLTLGMAVDGNILIFERLREESDHAKSLAQAVKLGFEKATSTILDANITTFVTAWILYTFGTGPVKGFAVVLMIGILTSVFSVLVIGRTLYDWCIIEKGWFSGATMRRLLTKQTTIGFMSKSRTALRFSAVLVVGALVAFFVTNDDKYGLDFLGGYKGQVRLVEAQDDGAVKKAVGSAFTGAQVVTVSDGSPTGSRQFVIKIKAGTTPVAGATDATGNAEVDLQEQYEVPLKAALAGLILPDFATDVVVTPDEEKQTTAVAATLNFEGKLSADHIATVRDRIGGSIAELGLENLGAAVRITGSYHRLGVDKQFLVQQLHSELKDAAGLPPLSQPFLESTTISGRVGTELRDSAWRAILLSFIAIVLYIRVRFHDFSYGWAAIAALAHDVSVALGVVCLVHYSGLVDVQLDLAMIAAFLTIIGYSLNDTIVLFDRVRENLPRVRKPLSEVLDLSINQTLGRTLLTSATTLVALLVIFVFNYGKHNVLEGFSFAMMIGVLVGTYSSIFIAAPMLRMLDKRSATAKAAS